MHYKSNKMGNFSFRVLVLDLWFSSPSPPKPTPPHPLPAPPHSEHSLILFDRRPDLRPVLPSRPLLLSNLHSPLSTRSRSRSTAANSAVVMEVEPVFYFHPGGDLEDDVIYIEELELQGNPNPDVTTLADVVNVEDDTVDKVNQVREKIKKRKLPPKTPKGPKPQKYRSPAWDRFEKIKEGDETWEKFNPLLYVAVALDPRFKLRLVKFCYTRSKGKSVGEKMEKQVKDVLNKLYDFSEKDGEVRQNVSSASTMPRVMEENEDLDHRLNLASEFDTYLEEEYSSVCSSEVNKYLGDLCKRRDNPDFDILVWWKNNSNKYPILAKMVRDVLAMPVSTFASESAFSTGGRVLDPFRSSLSPSMVETLVWSVYMGLPDWGALWSLDIELDD
ncbi:hypothetical protein RHMOL_Rhmol06G0288400 [Rhododendron molle]|uniref:Uncharacterized protein n=1 Tax=Rhododendron molle TaxID=49168 RepID=A0ACC0NHH1_RHOML|nr:hypothetical protein RHMOL_Rhmol06G0288400 [Rhododendron molle]